tara:strand:- start:271 stop:966 length:696 start_codon:yes stop_codon:yes gene_type:complete
METIEKFKPESIPNSSFTVVLAKRRGGKSTLVSDLVKKLYDKDKLDCVMLFSGTDADFPMIDKQFRFNDIEKLGEIVDRYKIMNEYNKIADPPNKFKIRTMIILDDLLLKLKSKDFKIIQDLAVNGRHSAYKPLCLHIVVLAQNLTSIPRLVRNNTDMIFFNNISSMKELELILDENLYLLDSSREGKKNARKLYNDLITSEDFLFMVIENYKQNVKKYNDYIKKYVADVK